MVEIEFTILEVYEQNGQLRVLTETKYGKDNLGLDINQKYLNPITKEPKFMDEVKELLYKKYT